MKNTVPHCNIFMLGSRYWLGIIINYTVFQKKGSHQTFGNNFVKS